MKILALLNPESGTKNQKTLKKEFIEAIEKYSVSYELLETSTIEEIYKAASEAADRNYETVIGIGGDGTINMIINAIATKNIYLGIVPTGTANLLATALGIPIDVKKAVKIIFEGKKSTLDLGKINDKYFAITAGCGFDAAIMGNINKQSKKLFGYMAYVFEGIKQAVLPKRSVFLLDIDGKKVKKRAVNVLFVNTGNILGNFITLVPDASPSDGFLDICIYSPDHTGEYIPVLWNILTKQQYDEEHPAYKMVHFKARQVKLKCRPRLPIQADGDLIGYPPVDISVCPDALKIHAPLKVDTFMMNPEEFFRNLLDSAFKDKEPLTAQEKRLPKLII
jgi:YegS/Rv2252/BmrU family lipid kinase